MDTDTREEFYKTFLYKTVDPNNDWKEAWSFGGDEPDYLGDEVWDFIEQKLKQARIEELERVYKNVGDMQGLARTTVRIKIRNRLAELIGETKTDWKTISELSRKLKPLEEENKKALDDLGIE